MGEHIDRLSRFFSSNLLNERQPMVPDHPAMFRIFIGNQSGSAQSKRGLFRCGFPFGNILQLPLDRPRKIHRRGPRLL